MNEVSKVIPISVYGSNYAPLTNLIELYKQLGGRVVYVPEWSHADPLSIPVVYDIPRTDRDYPRRHVDANCSGFLHKQELLTHRLGVENPFEWIHHNPLTVRILTQPSARQEYAVLATLRDRHQWLEKGAHGYPGADGKAVYKRSAKCFRQAIDANRSLYQAYSWHTPSQLSDALSELMRNITKKTSRI